MIPFSSSIEITCLETADFLTFRNEVVDNIKSWDLASMGQSGAWEINSGLVFELIKTKHSIEEYDVSLLSCLLQ